MLSYTTQFNKSLKNVLDKVSNISDEDFEAFASLWSFHQISKKTKLLDKGQQEEYLYFILEGAQRIYYYDEQDREATIIFTYANSFGGVIDSFLNRTKSKYFHEALSDSVIFKMHYADFIRLNREKPELALLIQKLLSLTIAGLLDRLVEMQCYSAEDKFKRMLSRSPHMLHLVPQKYLANYLGIDPTNFSKFINRIKI